MPRPPRAGFPPPTLIATTEALQALCDRLAAEEFVTVDTEFMRERTYWPELCVVQLAGDSEVAVIDAQAPEIDLAPLGHLLGDQAVMKVFHAARQDIEIFVLRFGDVPRPLFDTQIAAMVAGFGEQVGYDALVSALARRDDRQGASLQRLGGTAAVGVADHLRRRRRHLSAHGLYQATRPACGRTAGSTGWAKRWRNWPIPRFTAPTPRRCGSGCGRAAATAAFSAWFARLAAWREREAQRVNIPRQRLLRDETLLEIAATAPADPEQLTRARGISRGFAEGRTGTSLLAAIAAAKALPEDALPEAPRSRAGARPSPALVSLLKVLLAAKCEDHHVAARLVASSDDIDRLATEDAPEIAALHGWRREVFGEDALALKQGRMALGVQGRRVKLIPA